MNQTAFLAPAPLRTAPIAGHRASNVRPRRAVTAVLDEPAVNPYLKQHSAGIVRDYLTRRAVHNVAYYFTEFGDSPSKRWLMRFENFEKQEKSDTFVDGEAFLQRMLRAPPEQGVIVQQHPRGFFRREFPFSISPFRIGTSVLASRKQLAAEWAADLAVVEAENLEIQRMACERVLEKDERVLNARRNLVFDVGSFAGDQTPLRFRNFRSLLVLVTQHAVARLQPFLRDTSNHEYMFLLQFVQRYGPLADADDFIHTLMAQPRQERVNPHFVIDPRALAMHIMDLRNVIAKEWISVMHGVPEEQLRLTRDHLERSAGLPATPGEDAKEA